MNTLPPKDEFLEKHGLQEKFEAAGISWDELKEIATHHAEREAVLENRGHEVENELAKVESVHFHRMRVKTAESLVGKIIRKRADERKDIRLDNYPGEIHDLVGVRVVHLYKADCLSINKAIRQQYKLLHRPVINLPEGRNAKHDEVLKKLNGKREYNKEGYCSIHYVVRRKRKPESVPVEIQVRTVFQEGWGEVSHRLVYPAYSDHPDLLPFFMLFSTLVDTADGFASCIRQLRGQVDQHRAMIAELKARFIEIIDNVPLLLPASKKGLIARFDGVVQEVPLPPILLIRTSDLGYVPPTSGLTAAGNTFSSSSCGRPATETDRAFRATTPAPDVRDEEDDSADDADGGSQDGAR